MFSFKGYLHRWLAVATQVAPFIADKILPVLSTSAAAAVATCTGESNGRTCGFKWEGKTYDGSYGAGQQMTVRGAVSSLWIGQSTAPVTNTTGGTSVGDANAGSQSDKFDGALEPLTAGDRAGAGILTAVLLLGAVGTFGWMSTGV
jgi:mannan endo-1,6-alpha-mannosidase